MLQEKIEEIVKKNSGKNVVGFDLGDAFAQISYGAADSGEVITVSSVAGTEQYNIPTVLCKRNGVNQWFYGKEAIKYAAEDKGILVENLVSLAAAGEQVLVGEEGFDAVALLTLFVKRSLSLLNMAIPSGKIEVMMFTVDNLDARMVDVLGQVVKGLQIKVGQVYFQSHMESFYYYMLNQPKELWNYQVLICDYNNDLKTLCLECNRRTVPQVVFIHKQLYPEITRKLWSEDEVKLAEQKKALDEDFLKVAMENCQGRTISTVYLLGDGFKEDWADESLRFLCRNRRVFQGNNLYSKGACFGAKEKLNPSAEGMNHVFLGEDKLKANIGMKVLRQGEESYYAMMDAGVNWYEVTADLEVILESGNNIAFIITPLTEGVVTEKLMQLEGIPERAERTCRLRIHAEMSSPEELVITVEDLGFGEIFASSGQGWTQTFTL